MRAARAGNSKTPSATKSRSKTFTGCWTCRSRHVKCDEARPSCARCANSGFHCEGYEVRLSWNSVNAPAKRSVAPPYTLASASGSFSISARETGDPQLLPFTLESMEDDDADLIIESGVATSSHGADGLPLHHEVREASTTESAPAIPSMGIPWDIHLSLHHLDQTLTSWDYPDVITRRHSSLIPHVLFPPTTQDESPRTSPNVGNEYSEHNGINLELGIGSGSEGDSQISLEILTSDLSSRDHNHQERSLCRGNPTLLRLDGFTTSSLQESSLQRRLLEHWDLHLCDALIPIPGIGNPFRNVLMPIALAGTQCPPDSSSPSLAVFHLICSASAFHVSQSSAREEWRNIDWAIIGAEHHNMALHHLGRSLLSTEPHYLTAILASFILCCVNEAITVGTTFWKVHIQGACHWLRKVDSKFWCQSKSSSILYQIFASLAIIIQSQLATAMDQPNISHSPLEFDHPDELYCLDSVFGLQLSTLKVIQLMNSSLHSQHRLVSEAAEVANARREDRHLQGTDPFIPDIDQLEVDLLLSIPPPVSTSSQEATLIHHLSSFFHYATIIHFMRSIRQTTKADAQPLVSLCVDHLKAASQCTDGPFSPLVWPVVIMAFECTTTEEQRSIQNLLKGFMKRTGLVAWDKVADLSTRFWAATANAKDQDMKWQDFLHSQFDGDSILI